MFELNEVLVPLDLSETAESTVERVLPLLSGERPVMVLLHVIEPKLVRLGRDHGLGTEAEVIAKMRASAAKRLDEIGARVNGRAEVTPVVSEGAAFYEIARKAEEFDVDAVILSKRPAEDDAESLFFGSTAERVVRACRRPVIVLPAPE